ncbi:MAG: hypothetical protein GKS06_09330 [Acidobacteria bacterium]|nr:hypothetical protein [Acidobacteriota bacterium]
MMRAALLAGLILSVPSPAYATEAWLVVICGVGGDAEHRATFDGRAQTLIAAATQDQHIDTSRVIYLAERPTDVEGATARSDAAGITAAFDRIGRDAASDATVAVVLFGHGSGQEPPGTFNIPGPDVGPATFETELAKLGERRVVFVNTSSASAGFLTLARPGRVVITATGNLREREEPRFGGYFVDAFAEGSADLDKDSVVSVREAFVYASQEVDRFYENEGRLQPEHAMLDDDGDAEPSRWPLDPADDGSNADGLLASRMTLGGLAAAAAVDSAGDPELARLITVRAAAQDRLDVLRGSKDDLDEDAYFDQLEELLLEIAELDQQIRARESLP